MNNAVIWETDSVSPAWGDYLPVDHDSTFWSPLAYSDTTVYRLLKPLQNKYEGLLLLLCTHHVCMGWYLWACCHHIRHIRQYTRERGPILTPNTPAPPVSTPISALIKDRQSYDNLRTSQSLISSISSRILQLERQTKHTVILPIGAIRTDLLCFQLKPLSG